MTRINLIEPEELCDQHLLAEHRELTRIPNKVCSGHFSLHNQPNAYTLGTGHVKFFYTRLLYLLRRYGQIHTECIRRGFNVQYRWPSDSFTLAKQYWQNYDPTEQAIETNMQRIHDRMPANPRYTNCEER